MKRFIIGAVSCLLWALMPLAAGAQTTTQGGQSSQTSQNGQSNGGSGDLSDLPIPSWGQAIIGTFDDPLHPVIGSVASGGAAAFGIGYDSPEDERIYREGEAMVSIRGFYLLEGEVGRRSESKRSQIGVFSGVRHMNRIDYFGIGPDTIFDSRSQFRLRETTFGTRGWYSPLRPLRVGGSAYLYVPDLGQGNSSSIASIEEAFPVSEIPGGFAQPMFGRYRAIAEFVYPYVSQPETEEAFSHYRGAYQLAFEANRDTADGRHNFHRWEGEVQQRIPGFRTGHRLTFHGFISSANDNADIPFFMLYTLGGGGGLKSFRPDLLGGDGTRATLRGFHSYRFRDRDLVLMQAEYRIPLFRHVDATVFVDSGQVAPRTSELFDDLRTSTGFSLAYVRDGRSLGRVDFGFGGGEGLQVLWSFGVFR
jgi:hypothetical protein